MAELRGATKEMVEDDLRRLADVLFRAERALQKAVHQRRKAQPACPQRARVTFDEHVQELGIVDNALDLCRSFTNRTDTFAHVQLPPGARAPTAVSRRWYANSPDPPKVKTTEERAFLSG
jgi:hypothetical protein